jgi:hypothetical protein
VSIARCPTHLAESLYYKRSNARPHGKITVNIIDQCQKLFCRIIVMTLAQPARISSSKPRKEHKMELVRRYWAMGQLCRQQAVFHPEMAWHWLAQAQRWEGLAETEIALLFRECHSFADAARSELSRFSRSEAA